MLLQVIRHQPSHYPNLCPLLQYMRQKNTGWQLLVLEKKQAMRH